MATSLKLGKLHTLATTCSELPATRRPAENCSEPLLGSTLPPSSSRLHTSSCVCTSTTATPPSKKPTATSAPSRLKATDTQAFCALCSCFSHASVGEACPDCSSPRRYTRKRPLTSPMQKMPLLEDAAVAVPFPPTACHLLCDLSRTPICVCVWTSHRTSRDEAHVAKTSPKGSRRANQAPR